MTSFKITNDDLAVRGLQESNKSPVISGPVMPVKASNPVQKSPENLALKASPMVRGDSTIHHTQRRKSDRRKSDNPVLLETRSPHDRRTKTDSSEDTEAENALALMHGIDETV